MASESKRALGLLTILLLAAVIAVVVLAILYSEEKNKRTSGDDAVIPDNNDSSKPPYYDEVDWNDCDDVAIIGAGIAGTYAAWRLRDTNKKITVFEYSGRIGGRCYTLKFDDIPDVNLEFGAMRFIPESHQIFNRTIHEIGLSAVDFGPGIGATPDSVIYLRGRHMRNEDIPNTEVPYYLQDEQKNKTLRQIRWQLFRDNTNVNPDMEGFLADKFNLRSKDGIELWKQSRQEFYLKYVNVDTGNYIQDIGGWDGTFNNVSAVGYIPISETGSSFTVKTIATGFQSVAERYLELFLNKSSKHSYKRNHQLKSIKKHNGKYVLTFQPTETVEGITKPVREGHYLRSKPRYTCAKKVILAIGRLALEHLDWEGLKQPEIKDYIQHSLFDIHAAKMYLAYDSPWWRDANQLPHYSLSDTPLRQTYDFGVSQATNKIVLNAAYTDSRLYVSYWKNRKQQGTRFPGTTDLNVAASTELVNQAMKYLSQIYNVSIDAMEEPSYAAIGFWDTYPYGSGWCYWRPGYDWKEVERKMTRPSANDDVFVASNSFSSTGKQSWTEGALENVELVLKYFLPDSSNE